MLERFNLNKTYQYLLIALAFLMPLTVSGANVIVVVICLIWLLSGSYKDKFNQIINSKLMLASMLFYFVHIIGMIWTADLKWGMHILHKMWYFILLLPIFHDLINYLN